MFSIFCQCVAHISPFAPFVRSLPLRRASPLSTAICPATCALPAPYLSDAHLPFPPLSVRLPVRCLLSTSPTLISPFPRCLSSHRYATCSLPLQRASLLSTAICPATGTLPALCLSDAHVSFPYPCFPNAFLSSMFHFKEFVISLVIYIQLIN